MVLKGVNWVHNDTTGLNGPVRSQLCYKMMNLGQTVLKGGNSGYTMTKIRLYGS